MIFSRHPLIYHIIFRFSHYPVVSTPLIAIYYILFTSFRSFHSFASPSSLCFDSSVVSRSCFYPRGREEGAERRERKEDRKGETGGIVVRVRYRCRRDTGVVRIAVTATAGGGWKQSPLPRTVALRSTTLRIAKAAIVKNTLQPACLALCRYHRQETRDRMFREIAGLRKDCGAHSIPQPDEVNWINDDVVTSIRFGACVYYPWTGCARQPREKLSRRESCVVVELQWKRSLFQSNYFWLIQRKFW